MSRRLAPFAGLLAVFLFACTPQPARPPAAFAPAPQPADNVPPESVPAASVSSPPTTQPAETPASAPSGPAATDADPKNTLPYLASDELQGRGVGLPGLDKAANFIASEFAADGLKPLPGQSDYFQTFTYATKASPGKKTALSFNGKPLALNTEYLPMKFSAQAAFSGPVAFVGYGISAPEVGYDDYDGIDVKGKTVIALRYEPMDMRGKSLLASHDGASGWSDHATFSTKAATAAAHGAAALLIVNPPDSEPDLLMAFAGTFGSQSQIPVYQVKQAQVDEILKSAGCEDLKALRDGINASFRPRSVVIKKQTISGNVQIKSVTAQIKNVAGMLPGKGNGAGEYVVLGAHYDHLGLGQLGHMLGPAGSIYHGADDNASGTATVLEVASRFGRAMPPPARSIVFICFTAEEEGLIGSEYFVKHSPIPLDHVIAMVNLDMVGRIRDQTLYLGGQGTARDFDAILAHADMDSPLKLKSIGRGGMGPSDHMSFAQRRIPVLFFFSGLHIDYHRPTDTADKINYEGIDEVADFAARVLTGLTMMPQDPYIAEADKDSMHLFGTDFSSSPQRRVILGVVPDYSAVESRVGVLISGTTPGTPADAAGMREGDLLVQFGPQKLENLMDLTEALARSKPGDKVAIKLIRGNQTLSFDVVLAERKG